MANNRLLHPESDILTVFFFSVTNKPRFSIDNFTLVTAIPHKTIEIQMLIGSIAIRIQNIFYYNYLVKSVLSYQHTSVTNAA